MTLGAVNSATYPGNGSYSSGDGYFNLNSCTNNNNASIYGATNPYTATNTYNPYMAMNTNMYNPYMMGGMYSTTGMQTQYNLNNQWQSYGIKANAQQIALTDQCNALAQVLSSGQEDEIMKEFNELENTLKTQPQFAQCTEQEVKAYAKNYFQSITGISLDKAIEENASGDFTTGFKKTFSLFGDDSTSKEDLLATVNGTRLKRGAEETKVAGEVTGIVAKVGAGAALGLAVTLGNPIGAVVGGAIGGIACMLKAIF